MRICHLSTVHGPFDARIFHKECRTLASAGHEVFFVVPHGRDEESSGVRILALPVPGNRAVRMSYTMAAAFFRVLSTGAQVVHFHDPELIFLAAVFRLLGKTVIYDVHEDVPKDILDKEWVGSLAVRKAVAFVAGAVEKFAARFVFDAVVAATPFIGSKFKRCFVIRNLPILSLAEEFEAVKVADGGPPLIVYSGGLTRIRGVRNMISAMEHVAGRARLLLMGEWEDEDFRRECEALAGYRHAIYAGFIPYGKHFAHIRSGIAGIINFLPLPNHEDALPNKPFEYMACGLPTVMSDFRYWREVFRPCAVFADPNDPRDIAAKIISIVDNAKLRKYLSDNSSRMIAGEYSWEAESSRLIEFYGIVSKLGR